MPFSEEMRQLLTANNFQFLFNGLKLTLYISFVSIILSTIFGTILAVLRNQTNGPLKLLASIYVEVVRNIPNLLWIYVIFLIFKIYLYHIFIILHLQNNWVLFIRIFFYI